MGNARQGSNMLSERFEGHRLCGDVLIEDGKERAALVGRLDL